MTILVSCVQHKIKKLEKVSAEVCFMQSTFEFNKGVMMIRLRTIKADHDKRHTDFFLVQRSQRLMRRGVHVFFPCLGKTMKTYSHRLILNNGIPDHNENITTAVLHFNFKTLYGIQKHVKKKEVCFCVAS